MRLVSELWKDIKELEGVYQISSKGNIRSLDRWVTDKNGRMVFLKGQPMKPRTQHSDGTGYMVINLRKKNKYVIYLVHRLVAKAFIPNPNNLEQVNHKDENKKNNDINNLEWCTRIENLHYGTAIDRMAEKHSIPIVQLDMNGDFIKEWESAMEADKNGFNRGGIRACIRGEQKASCGYKWVSLEDYNKSKE